MAKTKLYGVRARTSFAVAGFTNLDGRENDKGKVEYSLQLLVDKDDKDAIAVIEDAVMKAVKEANPNKKPSKWHNPLEAAAEFTERQRDKEANDPDRFVLPEIYDKSLVFNFKTTLEQPPLYNYKAERTEDYGEVVPGDIVRVSFIAKWFEYLGKTGVTFYLQAVQKKQDGERLWGGNNNTDNDFDAVERDASEFTAEDSEIPW